MIAYLNLRYLESSRAELFRQGLSACGYTDIRGGAGIGNLLVTWNRIGQANDIAKECERRGIPVLVCENASWGKLVPGKWLHMARRYHNSTGCFTVGSPSRWRDLNIQLAPFREEGGETVVLGQRGIGSAPTAQPRNWWQQFKGTRMRCHPGRHPELMPSLKKDLAKASKVITWGSASAVEALAMGIRVESHYPHWIGGQENTETSRWAMFWRMSWAQWRFEEIASGEAFRCLLRG